MNDYVPNPMLQNIVKKPKRPNMVIIFLSILVVILLIIILVLMMSKPKVVTKEVQRQESLEDVAMELEYFIDENKLDALDAYGYDNLTWVAINKICYGVDSCIQIQGDAVKKYISDVFDVEVTFSDVNCYLNDGPLYSYDSVNHVFIWNDTHAHGGLSTIPIYSKVNSIKRNDDKIELVLNKLYYNPGQSDYITTDPLNINRVYSASDYMHKTENGEDIDLTKLKADYDNDFDKLKNTGDRYKYTFGKKDGHYVLEKYEVISEK